MSGILAVTPTSTQTWNLTDTVSGTTATTDSISVTVLGHSTANTKTDSYNGLSTTAIENFNFRYVDASVSGTTVGTDGELSTIGASGFAGATKIAVANSTVSNTTAGVDDTLTFTGVAAAASLELANNSRQLNVNFTNTGTATSGDALTVALGGGATGDVTLRDAAGDGFVTVNATTATAASTLQKLDGGSDFTTLNVTGDQGLTIADTLASTVTTINAAGNSGAVKVATQGTTLNATGGTGSGDVLMLDVAPSTGTIAGFETILAGGAVAINLANVTGATTLGVEVGATGPGAVSFTNAAATQNTLVFSGANQGFRTPTGTDSLTTSGTVGYALATATGAADTLNLTFDNGGSATTGTLTVGGALTANGVEAINLNVADWRAVTLGGITDTVTTNSAFALTATGSTNLTLNTVGDPSTGTASSTYNFSGITTTVVDASTTVGSVNLTLGDTGSLTYTGSAGVDTVTNAAVAATKTQTFNLGAGNDVYNIVDTAAAATASLIINGDAGDDNFSFAASAGGTGKITVNGGLGTDTLLATNAGAVATSLTATISGIEKINIQNTGGSFVQTFALTVAGGYADTVVITDVPATAAANAISLNSTGNVNISNWSGLGWASGTDTMSVTGSGTITGWGNTQTLNGGANADSITGGVAADTIVGNASNDTISGGTGDDSITGGAGADSMTGGTGTDTFAILAADSNTTNGIDLITDFVGGTDVLNLATAGTETVNTGSDGADVSNNSAAVASTGTTITTLLANLQTAADALGANLFDHVGDTFSVQLTGASYAGAGAYYVVQNTAADTTVGADDTIIALIGTSTSAITVATIV